MAEVIKRGDAWRDTESERGFSMALGRLGDPADGDCLLVEAVQNQDNVVAMLSLVPWGNNGVSLDLMRRSPQSPNGTIELMVTELSQQSEGIGINRISLNFAMFRSAFEQGAQLGAGPIARLWRGLLVFFSRWWQLETLYRSNMKYQPEWVPRYACYEDARLIPRVGVASVIAEGFLVLPFSRRNKQPHTGHHIAAPENLVATGLLHHDGSAPDLSELQADLPETGDEPRLPEQVRVRMAKLKGLQDSGVDAYPVGQAPSHTVAQAIDATDGTSVTVAGRVLRIRDYGGVLFAQLRDWSGEVQLLLDNSRLDTGSTADFTGCHRSRRPHRGDRHDGPEQVRHPLADRGQLAADRQVPAPAARQVEGAHRPGGAGAGPVRRPGHQHRGARAHPGPQRCSACDPRNTGRQGVFGGRDPDPAADPRWRQRPPVSHPHQRLRSRSLSAYRPRAVPQAVVRRRRRAGLRAGRAFRNEGVDFSHNPEFTLLEAYQAHADYNVWIDGCRELIQNAALAANGEHVFLRPRDDGTLEKVDISGQWAVKTVHGAVSEALGEQIGPDTDLTTLRKLCEGADIPYLTHWDAGAVVLELYERLVEDSTEEPTFYKDFPTSVSPLTRPHRSIPGVAERWDLVAWGVELGTAYSELTDPVEQRRRLQEQSLLAAGGDPEAMELDEDFLQAMEYAMPPTGGLGMGVDRVVMLITGRSIRETLPFPLAKPR